MLKRLYRDQRGLTLIELLAVIVILAIIAAIAIPSIGGIINKTKKEAHRANAQMIIDGARFKVTTEGFNPDTTGGNVQTITLEQIVSAGYLDKEPKDPQGTNNSTYHPTATKVTVTQNSSNGSLTYRITLVDASGNTKYSDNKTEEEIKTVSIGGGTSPSPSNTP